MAVAPNTKRKVFTLSLLTLFAVSLLLATIPGLIERWLNQYDLQGVFHRLTGGSITTGTIQLHVLPTPYLTVHGGELDIPNHANGSWQEIRIHPVLKSLVFGPVRFHKISLIGPDIRLCAKPGAGGQAPPRVEAKRLTSIYLRHLATEALQRLGGGAQWLSAHAPLADIHIGEGRLQLVGGLAHTTVALTAIDCHLTSSTRAIQIELNAKSSLVRSLQMNGTIDAEMQTGRVTLGLDNLDVERVAALTGLDQRLDRTEGLLSGEMNIEFKGAEVIESQLTLELPLLTLQRLEKPLRLRNVGVDGVISIDDTGIRLDLNRLRIDSPRLNVTGYVQADEEIPELQIHLEGRGIEIAEARQTTLTLAGDNPTTVKIFDVLRAGQVPWIRWRTHGPNVAALKAFRNMTLEGEVKSGRLFIPRADFELTHVSGIAEIADGALRGRNLAARHQATTGRDGNLWIDFGADNDPLFLKIDTHLQDVGQLPPLLMQWVHHTPFQAEMQRLRQVNGQARGILILDSRRGRGLEVTADVAHCQLSALYDRLPWQVQIEKGQVLYTRGQINVDQMQGAIGTNRFSDLKAQVTFEHPAQLYIDAARLTIDIQSAITWVTSLKALKSAARRHRITGHRMNIERLHLQGPFFNPAQWKYQVAGRADRWELTTAKLPDSLRFRNFVFEADENTLMVRHSNLKALDTDLTVSSRTVFREHRLRSAKVHFKGTLGRQADKWINDQYAPDEDYLLMQAPLTVSTATIDWAQGKPLVITADFTTSQGVEISLAEEWQRDRFRKERFRIRDGDRQAVISMDWRPDQMAVAFEGILAASTLKRLLLSSPVTSGRIEGDIQATIVPAQLARSTAGGHIRATNLLLPLDIAPKIHISHLHLSAEDNRLKIDPSAFLVDGNWHTLEGDIQLAADRYHVALRHEGAYFELPTASPQGAAVNLESYLMLPVEGTIQSHLSLLKWGDQHWVSVKTANTLIPGKWDLRIGAAELCGIQTSGTIVLETHQATIDLEHTAHKQALNPTLTCLLKKNDLIDGHFQLKGDLAGAAPMATLGQTINGNFTFEAQDGRIYRFDLLGRILAAINLTELVRGQKSDLMDEGLAYREIDIEARLEDNIITLDKVVINGASVEIAAKGTLDLAARTIDLVVLVAPLKTVDALVKYTPIVNTWLEGTLISIPVKVSGSFNDPVIVPLSPSAIGSSLLNLLRNTIELPIKLIEPLIDNDGADKAATAP